MKPVPKPTPEQVDLLEKLCKKLRVEYNVQKVFNPSLQSFYTNLESAVYDEEPKPVEDWTLPDLELHDQEVQPFLEQIDEEFGSVR